MAGLFKQRVLQFRFKTLLKKCKEILWFVFLQSCYGKGGGCIPPQECVAAWKQEAAGVGFCLGW